MTVQRDYEQLFAAYIGRRHAFSFWKGRVAMYAILRALGVSAGDEVILPGYTCVMNVNPIFYLGAKPVYVDIEPTTYNLDPAKIEAAITPTTKVLIAQHTYGYAVDMDAVLAIAARHQVTVVEDCCLALGSRYKGKLLGTFGKAAYFSSQWNKPYTTGIGGMAVTDDDALASAIQELIAREQVRPQAKEVGMIAAELAVYRTFIYPRTTALATNLFRWLTRKGIVVGSSSMAEFSPTMASDFFKAMSGVQARAGRRQIRRLPQGVEHRHLMAAEYERLLRERGFSVPPIPADMQPALVRYPVRVADKEKALATAANASVELGSWFECPLHPIDTPLQAYGYERGMCPIAERACREVVNLPTHPRANFATARRSVDFIASIGPVRE